MTPVLALLVALGGGAGAVTRFVTDSVVARRSRLRIPLGTLVINVSGSLLLGLLAGALGAAAADSPGGHLLAVAGTGFCGGYTTFSTASLEVVRLWLGEGRATGWAYALATLAGSLLAAGVGLAIGGLLA